ncbi:MAG TPA: SMI1/KNR4 family protein [Pyrinomonadaceae bacterium]|nr:SMI1/KNR4 family protein [Pyrinomonadaceae bacterium]
MSIRPSIPKSYSDYVRDNGLFEGFFGLDSDEGYIQMWATEEIPSINDEIEIDLSAPGLIAFASDGGGEYYTFDSMEKIFMIPAIGIEPEFALFIANSFPDLVSKFQGNRYRSHPKVLVPHQPN